MTGAASGIGRSLALALVREGAEVGLSDVDVDGLAETARACRAAATARGAREDSVSTRTLDVTSLEAQAAWADDLVQRHGKVNLVFNNAGIAYSATVEGGDDADVRRVIDVDFWGVVHGTRVFLPHLEASGDGHVVNISSVFGLFAFPGTSAYNAAKFAVRGFTEALRIELDMQRSCVTATCVHPGGIKTNIARASKTHPSLERLGIDPGKASSDFEKNFRTTPDKAAEIILRGVRHNRRRVLVGPDAHLLDLMQRVLPTSYQGVIATLGRLTAGRR